jgi:hypothetical protein
MPTGYERQDEESPVPEQFQTKMKEEVITVPVCEICGEEEPKVTTCKTCGAKFCEYCGSIGIKLCIDCGGLDDDEATNDPDEDYVWSYINYY